MSKKDYVKWQTEPNAYLSKIGPWLGGDWGHIIWKEVNQYLPSNLEEQDYKQYRVITKYNEDFDGMELIFGDENNQWGAKLNVMAQSCVFKKTDDDTQLVAELRDGFNIKGQPRGFQLMKWTIDYQYPTGVVKMVWKEKDKEVDQAKTLSWNYIPYVKPLVES